MHWQKNKKVQNRTTSRRKTGQIELLSTPSRPPMDLWLLSQKHLALWSSLLMAFKMVFGTAAFGKTPGIHSGIISKNRDSSRKVVCFCFLFYFKREKNPLCVGEVVNVKTEFPLTCFLCNFLHFPESSRKQLRIVTPKVGVSLPLTLPPLQSSSLSNMNTFGH